MNTRLALRLLLLAGLVLAALAAAACSKSETGPSPAPAGSSAAASTATAAPPSATPAPGTVTPPPALAVPDRYRATYAELDSAISAFESRVGPTPKLVTETGGAVSVSLLQVNSNQAPAILQPAVLEATKTYLDELRSMGVTAVEMQIAYPVMSEEFPDRDRYVALYRAVVDAAHQRGLKVLIETSCIFSGSTFTDIKFDFATMSADQYFDARTRHAVAVAALGPDYLALGEEPVNERVFAGIDFTEDQYIAYVNGATRAIRQSLPPGSTTKVGVGTGTWEFQFFTHMVERTEVDFFDIHLYPLQGTPGGYETVRQMASLAKAKGKPVVIGETWLYKLSRAESGPVAGATAAEAFRRDAFSFWAPLDFRHARNVLALGAEFEMPLVSFWGARFMHANLEWTPENDALDFRGVSRTVNPVINRNIASGSLTPLGQALEALITR